MKLTTENFYFKNSYREDGKLALHILDPNGDGDEEIPYSKENLYNVSCELFSHIISLQNSLARESHSNASLEAKMAQIIGLIGKYSNLLTTADKLSKENFELRNRLLHEVEANKLMDAMRCEKIKENEKLTDHYEQIIQGFFLPMFNAHGEFSFELTEDQKYTITHFIENGCGYAKENSDG